MNIGLTLMIVGMVTVFAVLLIIINLSELLIQCVNKIAPEETTAKKNASPTGTSAVTPDVMAVIRQTVSQITGGRGTVTNVTPI